MKDEGLTEDDAKEIIGELVSEGVIPPVQEKESSNGLIVAAAVVAVLVAGVLVALAIRKNRKV